MLTAFDLQHLHVGLAADLGRYATASALAEVMLRFAPADPHPESYDLFRDALARARGGAGWASVEALGFRRALAPGERAGLRALARRVRARRHAAARGRRAPVQHPRRRRALPRLRRRSTGPPGSRPRPAPISWRCSIRTRRCRRSTSVMRAAHRRLLARYVRYHLAEGAELPALEFWLRRPWVAA